MAGRGRRIFASDARAPFETLASALAAVLLASGCGCTEALFPTQCSRVRVRATEALSCPNVQTQRRDRASITKRSVDDADTYTVCCNFGDRPCAYYVCPKGRSDNACYRAD